MVVVVAGLRAAGPIILPFLVAVFLAIISLPFMSWLQRNGAPRTLAVICTIMVVIALLACLVYVVSRSVNEFTAAAPRYRERLQEFAVAALDWIERRGIRTAEWRSPAVVNPGALIDLVGGTLSAVAAVLSNIFLVLLTLIFILFEAAGFSRKLGAAFGARYDHVKVAVTMRQVQHYLAIKTLISLANGVAVGLWVAFMGLGVPLLWGLIAFIFNYVPNIGSVLAAIPPILIALIQFGPGRAAIVALGYIAIDVVVANLTEPHLMGRRLGLSTLVVFLSLIFWGWVWGPFGMLLSVPLTMTIKIALENTEDFRWLAVLLAPNPAAPQEATRKD